MGLRSRLGAVASHACGQRPWRCAALRMSVCVMLADTRVRERLRPPAVTVGQRSRLLVPASEVLSP